MLTSITRLNTKACSDSEDQEKQPKRKPIASSAGHSVICVVLEGENHKHQDSTGDELGEEHAGFSHVRLGIRAKNSRCRCRARRHCADSMAFESIYVVDVVAVYDAGSDQTAQKLREEVHRKPSPWELAEKAIGESDCWVQVRAGVASHVHSQHYSDAASTVSGQH